MMTPHDPWRDAAANGWVVNEIAARVDRTGPRPVSEDHRPGLVPPDLDWLINTLAGMNVTGQSDAVILKHARTVMYLLSELSYRGRGPVQVIGTAKKGFAVTGWTAPAEGLAKQLQRLEAAARSGSTAKWLRAWAASPHECRRLIWVPPIVKDLPYRKGQGYRLADRRSFVGVGGHFIGPRASDALPVIIHARRELAAKPLNERRGNTAIQEASALVKAIREAVLELTGRVGLTDNRIKGLTTGPLVDFMAVLDARFGTKTRWRKEKRRPRKPVRKRRAAARGAKTK